MRKVILGAIATLVVLVNPAIADDATKGSAVFQQLRKAIIALDCSEYADSPGTFLERNRLRQIGLQLAGELYDRYKAGKLDQKDAGLVEFSLRAGGLFGKIEGHDNKEFVLGRVFEGEVAFVRQQIKESPNPATAAKDLYKQNNCDLID